MKFVRPPQFERMTAPRKLELGFDFGLESACDVIWGKSLDTWQHAAVFGDVQLYFSLDCCEF